MKFVDTNVAGVILIEHTLHTDSRGLFRETWNRSRYLEAGFLDIDFVQVNHSRSQKNVVRGLHFQRQNPQGKLLHVTNGAVLDVAVDIRVGSRTFGDWTAVELSVDNGQQLWIPPGLAHGFCALTDDADLVYLCSEEYDAESDGGVRWDDAEIGIKWPVSNPLLSDKDLQLPSLAEAVGQGLLPEPAT